MPQKFDTTSNSRISLMRDDGRKIFTIIFGLYLSLTLVRYLIPANILLTSAVTLIGLISLLLLSLKIPRDNVLIYLFTGLLTTAFLVSSLFVSREDRVGHVVLFILFNLGIALILLRVHVYAWASYIVYYGICFFFLILIFSGVDPNDALKVVSRNGISEMVIVPCICLYIINSNAGKEIDLTPAFVCLLISVWGVGRAGILSSVMLFVGLYFIKKDSNKTFLFTICFIFIICNYFL